MFSFQGLSFCPSWIIKTIKRLYCFLLLFKAQLVDLRSELTETQAEKVVLDKEVHDQLLQLHSTQLQLHAKTGQSADSGTIKAKLVSEPWWAVVLWRV